MVRDAPSDRVSLAGGIYKGLTWVSMALALSGAPFAFFRSDFPCFITALHGLARCSWVLLDLPSTCPLPRPRTWHDNSVF
ncbi:hypothetical protein SISNIDRAFT_124491 [Sistotremastrum niveocremeum HHB9708]|uniref:Uncharacterized protein n=1 Tax=Sistotremastrum niveocremeum HHB9708 TaxID=1314777 RepID=A0A164T9I7_9AGAM|nr:hypothetical protein SISNIDRAFT_124491 [Sistotremastrum niveocremeum HHB9708]